MKTANPFLILWCLLLPSVGPLFGQLTKSPPATIYVNPQDTPLSTILNINHVAAWYTSDGVQERRPIDGNSGLAYPRGAAAAIYTSGFVYGGVFMDGKEPTLRFNGSMYQSGLKAGRILGLRSGAAEDPDASDVRIWRVRRDYPTADLTRDAAEVNYTQPNGVTQAQIDSVRKQYEKDWAEWPADKGAPFYDADSDGRYEPDFKNTQTNGVREPVLFPRADEPGIANASQVIWFVANDLGVTQPWACPESGLELQFTIWGFDRPDPLAHTVFKSCRIIYKGSAGTPEDAIIDDMYIAHWSDPDLGYYGDDFVGCDTLLNLGFVYNSNAQDQEYAAFGLPPPAVGYDLLQGPIVPAHPGEDRNRNGVDDAAETGVCGLRRARAGFINLPMTSFWLFASGGTYGTPLNAVQWYQVLRGLPPYPPGPPDPPPVNDPTTGRQTNFWCSGDPVSGVGWVDGFVDNPGDRRMIMSTGPFSMAIGDTQEIVVAWVGGLHEGSTRSINALKGNDRFVQAFFDSLVVPADSIPPPPEDIPLRFSLGQNYPNPFNSTTTIEYALPEDTHVRVDVFNMLGQRVVTLFDGEQSAGIHQVVLDASDLASGSYVYRLQAGYVLRSRRFLLMQ